MSLFDSASVVITPSAYKASKLYAIKPTDGSGDLTVVRATTARRVNSAGLIESVANNVPRLDYTNGSCSSILVEPQRTNLALYSEQFDNVAWSKENSTITSNSIISPDGTLTADKLVESANVNFHRISFVASVSNTTYSVSIFAKKLERDYLVIRTNVSGINVNTCFDLNNGSVVYNGHLYSSIVDYGGGWYRCVITQTSTITTTRTIGFLISDTEVTNNTIPSYLGDGTSGIYIWGAQLEAGANATSYIPTTSASVTRNADVISKTGISSLIGQTEGTIFVDCKDVKVGLSRLFEIFNLSNTGTNIFLNLSSSGALQIILNGATVNTATGNVVDLDKVIFKYTSDSIKLFNNGVLIGSYSGAVSFSNALDTLAIGGTTYTTRTINGNIKLVGLWKTALTDQECINLTTI